MKSPSSDSTDPMPSAAITAATKDSLASRQHHTIPRWFLQNFADLDGMLHVTRRTPRKFFKSKPGKAFRRRDYYAAREVGQSMENQTERLDSLAAPHVSSILRAMGTEAHDRAPVSIAREIEDDVRACGLFLLHLGCRSPRWMGEDLFEGVDALRLEAERTGKDATAMVYESSMELIQSGDFVLVSCDLDEPAFFVGDCGPFICRDAELGVNNEKRMADDQDWAPAEQRLWMALSPNVALGVAPREAHAKLTVSVLSDTAATADWVEHFNEVCARHSEMIAGVSRNRICKAAQSAWPDG